MRIQVLNAKEINPKILKPYILVEVGTKQMTELALVDIGAGINAISYENWEHISKPPMEKSIITVDTM